MCAMYVHNLNYVTILCPWIIQNVCVPLRGRTRRSVEKLLHVSSAVFLSCTRNRQSSRSILYLVWQMVCLCTPPSFLRPEFNTIAVAMHIPECTSIFYPGHTWTMLIQYNCMFLNYTLCSTEMVGHPFAVMLCPCYTGGTVDECGATRTTPRKYRSV